MGKSSITILIASFVALGISLIMKYVRKQKGGNVTGQKPGSSFTSHSKDDDYEPYSKKQ